MIIVEIQIDRQNFEKIVVVKSKETEPNPRVLLTTETVLIAGLTPSHLAGMGAMFVKVAEGLVAKEGR